MEGYCRMEGPRFFCTPLGEGDTTIRLVGQDAKHIGKVLRLKPGDSISVSDGQSRFYNVELVTVSEREVTGSVKKVVEFKQERFTLKVFQGIPKGRKMNLIVEKLTELGASEIVPVVMERSVPEFKRGQGGARTARWRQIALEAAKQSRRKTVPEVVDIIDWDDALERLGQCAAVLVPYEEERTTRLRDLRFVTNGEIALVIGPEGGFEAAEVAALRAAGAMTFTMGEIILRTETAAVAAAALVMDRLR